MIAVSQPTSLYLYFDKHDILIYVGITGRGLSRNSEHATKSWWPYVCRQEVRHFDSREAASAAERQLIRKHCPPFNTQHNPASERVRVAYLAFREGQDAKPRRALASVVELDCHDPDPLGRLRFRTRLEDADIASALLPIKKGQVRAYGFRKNPSLVCALEKVGPVAVLTVARHVSPTILRAYANVRLLAADAGVQLRNMHVVTDRPGER